jgi:hypothetical protein
MSSTFPVLWQFHDTLSTGRLDLDDERLTLTGRDRSFSTPRAAVVGGMVERAHGRRLRGLAALTLELAGGEQVRVASLGGVGSLHEIALLVSASQEAEPARQSSCLHPAPTPQ